MQSGARQKKEQNKERPFDALDGMEGAAMVFGYVGYDSTKAQCHEPTGEDLKAARVSLGALGVIYKVQIRVVKKFYLRHIRTVVEMREELDRFEGVLNKYRNVEYWYYPYTGLSERMVRYEIPWAATSPCVQPLSQRAFWMFNPIFLEKAA